MRRLTRVGELIKRAVEWRQGRILGAHDCSNGLTCAHT